MEKWLIEECEKTLTEMENYRNQRQSMSENVGNKQWKRYFEVEKRTSDDLIEIVKKFYDKIK